MDHGSKGYVCPVAPHGDAPELLDLAEDGLDEMARFEQGFIERASVNIKRSISTSNHIWVL
ncbi:hypothetical protein ACTOI6_12235 [Komagataeibacter intermedius]